MVDDDGAAMVALEQWSDDRAAPIATRIIARAIRAVLLPALSRLHRLHRR
jgi:hypothetical protein